VLLIACANIANLTLVRSLARRREYSTKMALGAGAGRLLRQIAIESAALAAVAGALAWRLTAWSVDEWATMTHSRYQILDYRVDSSTATYLLAITIGCGLVLCAAPMFSVIQLGIAGALKPAGRSLSPDARHRRLARELVAAQMALAIVLLAGSGVLVRSLRNIVGADAGVSDPDHVMMGLLRLPSADYADAEARASYFGRVEASLRTASGIENVTLATTTPVRGVRLRGLEIDGRPDLAEGERFAAFVGAGPEYFELLRRRPVVGRAFNQDDTAAAPLVAVVNEKFAGKYWPGESAVGKRLRAIDRNTVGEWRIVVGVVPNIMQNDALRQTFQPLVYVPFEQEPRPLAAFFLARTRVPPVSLASAIRDAVQGIDPQVALERFSTLRASFAFERDFMDAEHSELGKYATVGPIFAVIALVLATIGLVAVIAHSVSQRTHEIGVRMAIGAAARDISRMIVREAMIPVGAGVAVGLAGAFAVNRVMHSQLVGVSPYDPMTMIATPLVLIAFALLACRLPAGRAARVDPVVALRHE
jgi:putative ABC transport system permease protein